MGGGQQTTTAWKQEFFVDGTAKWKKKKGKNIEKKKQDYVTAGSPARLTDERSGGWG